MANSTKKKPEGKKRSGKKQSFSARKLIFGVIIASILAVICAMGIYIVVIMSGFKILDQNLDKIETTSEATLILAQGEDKDAQPLRDR
ncbi:hypothetical protein [Paenibacillus hexagrammi]|uniref:Uncharacterized protein n=1 Tax=Paenibacillus hexagrammi TaxID=2908839 RepID=A0ABY3SPU5_9BACL|nr:hypothetical protein [Paenibacillus sp. YPD9-1]UJF36018.1 hypothetical protein L0M14_13625 [Paenibacillus sp. YPD9-1]